MNIQEQKNLWGNPDNWVNEGHEWSTYFGTTGNLWNIIYPKFSNYLKGEVLEISPGYGRMTSYLLTKINDLSVVDLNDNCIEKCKSKFGNKIKNYVINNGYDLEYFENNYFDFIFSYDSFVHMTEDVIESYIKEIFRVLKHNSYSFIHHSFFYGSEIPTKNLGGRSSMTPKLFSDFVTKYNMKIISQEDFQTSETISDILTTFYKP